MPKEYRKDVLIIPSSFKHLSLNCHPTGPKKHPKQTSKSFPMTPTNTPKVSLGVAQGGPKSTPGPSSLITDKKDAQGRQEGARSDAPIMKYQIKIQQNLPWNQHLLE